MTIIERIKNAIENHNNWSEDNIDKLIAVAYYIGREEATRQVSDAYTAHISKQKARAAKCRYKHMAAEIVGPENHLYFGDYAMEFSQSFGQDDTSL